MRVWLIVKGAIERASNLFLFDLSTIFLAKHTANRINTLVWLNSRFISLNVELDFLIFDWLDGSFWIKLDLSLVIPLSLFLEFSYSFDLDLNVRYSSHHHIIDQIRKVLGMINGNLNLSTRIKVANDEFDVVFASRSIFVLLQYLLSHLVIVMQSLEVSFWFDGHRMR